MPIKSRLIQMLTLARDEEMYFINSLSLDERNTTGSFERWSSKDLVAFLAFIRGLSAHRLLAASAGQEPEHNSNPDELSAEVYQANHDRPWDEVLNNSERSFQSLMGQVKKFSNEELADLDCYPWRKGRPLWQMIIGPGYVLPYYHLAHFHFARGDASRANFSQEQVVESLNQMDSDPTWQARSFYNLACFYATTGQKERAVSRLQEAFTLNPGLRDWSKQDRDLLSLHHEPAFQALFADLV